MLLFDVEEIDGIDILPGELEGDCRAICHVEPAACISERAMLAARLASPGEAIVVEILLYEPRQRVLEQRIGEELPLVARVSAEIAL